MPREVDEEMDTRGICRDLEQSTRGPRNFHSLRGKGSQRRATRDAQAIRARKYARAEAIDANFLKMPTSFANPLETRISCFAKLSRMPTLFGKLLEMLCIWEEVKLRCLPGMSWSTWSRRIFPSNELLLDEMKSVETPCPVTR